MAIGLIIRPGIAPDYIITPAHLQDKLVQALKTSLDEFFPSKASLLDSKDFSKIVNSNHFERLKKLLDESHGEVVIGGQTDEKKNKIAFTVVKGVTEDDSTMAGEIFGPILPIITAESNEDIVKFIEKRDQPLALYVFTSSSKNMDYSESGRQLGVLGF